MQIDLSKIGGEGRQKKLHVRTCPIPFRKPVDGEGVPQGGFSVRNRCGQGSAIAPSGMDARMASPTSRCPPLQEKGLELHLNTILVGFLERLSKKSIPKTRIDFLRDDTNSRIARHVIVTAINFECPQ